MDKKSGKTAVFMRVGSKLLPISLYILGRPVRRELNREINTILDIGCGKGLICRPITRSGKYFTVGAEIYEPDLREAQKNHTHSAFIRCDIQSLPLKSKSFDVVLCTQVLEHVTKEEGLKLLKDMEEIAVTKVILSTPKGYLHTTPENSANPDARNNEHQEHKSGWEAKELEALGYRVYYNNYLYKLDQFISNRFHNWSWWLNSIVFTSLGLLLWISPGFGAALFCVKELNNKSRANPVS